MADDGPTELQKPTEEKELDTSNNNNYVKENPGKPDPDKNLDIYKDRNNSKETFMNIFLLVCLAGVLLGVLLELIIVVNRSPKFDNSIQPERQRYWVYSNTDLSAKNKKSVTLKHVHTVLERVGYQEGTNETPWTLLWSHIVPFKKINLRNLRDNQFVNHFPGTGHITSKVHLATTDSKYIPKAFALPKDKDKFLKYAAENKNALFVQKQNTHRQVYLKNVSEIDMTDENYFVQEYIKKPFLVDGHKFDIGVYGVLKSVNPLRVYLYKGDMLFRYCPLKYYPFDPTILDKYVVADDYLPTWEVPSLARYYTAEGNTMKESFDIYARSVGKDPANMWEEVQKAIADVFIKKEHLIIEALKEYGSSKNFFQMMRFDLIVDENLKVYLLEANMSPNLCSQHFPPNGLLYEQMLYNLFSLTGVTRASVTAKQRRAWIVDDGEEHTKRSEGSSLSDREPLKLVSKKRDMIILPKPKNIANTVIEDQTAAKNMITAQKNLGVFGNECSTTCRDSCEAIQLCLLCKPCLGAHLKKNLLDAYGEFLHKGDFKRLIPPPMVPNTDIESITEEVKHLSQNNKLLHMWYQGKCNQDITWCKA